MDFGKRREKRRHPQSGQGRQRLWRKAGEIRGRGIPALGPVQEQARRRIEKRHEEHADQKRHQGALPGRVHRHHSQPRL